MGRGERRDPLVTRVFLGFRACQGCLGRKAIGVRLVCRVNQEALDLMESRVTVENQDLLEHQEKWVLAVSLGPGDDQALQGFLVSQATTVLWVQKATWVQ